MICVKCGNEIPEGAAFCPNCGERVGRSGSGSEAPLYQANVKTLLKSGRLIVYRDRTEFVTSSVQKAIFDYTGLVSVKKNLSNGIDFITEDGRTETCPADRKCVHEALVYIEQAAGAYLAQRKERLLSQGIRYSFPSNQGLLNDGVLNLSNEQAEFRAKTGKTDVVSYRDVKAASANGGTLDFKLFGGGTKSYAVGKELRDEVLAFVTSSIAPYLAQRKKDLLAQGIYFSSYGPDGGTLDILADRAEYKGRSGQVEGCVPFRDVRTTGLHGGMLELALTDGTSRSFPIEEDIAAEVLAFVKKAIEPYVTARTVGFDAAFGIDERIEFNDERGVFHLIRQGGREITGEWPTEGLIRCEWTEDKRLTALGSVVSGGIGLFKSAAKAAGSRTGTETEEKIGSVDVVLTFRTDRDAESQSVCFSRSSVGMSRADKKYGQCLSEWAGLSEYLQARCPECEIVDPVIPESASPESAARPEAGALPEHAEAENTESVAGTDDVPPGAPVRRDDSGIARCIDGVTRFIGNCETPMTIAFLGNSGSGKSSVLGMLFDQMEDRYCGSLFWLNARQLLKGESGEALSALAGKALAGQLSGDGIAAKQAGSFLTGLAGLATGIIAGDTSLGKEIAGGVLNKNSANAQEDPVITFSRLIKAKTQGEKEKIIFFIDGLNQLPPARAVELLDAMRDFFECKGCVFVVSADYADIVRGAQERYDDNKAKRFFDGMFKMTFRVPSSSFNVKGYAKGKLEDIGVQVGGDAELELYAALIQNSVGKDTAVIDHLFTSSQLLKDMTDGEVYKDRYKRLVLFALLCMQMRFRDAYDYAIGRRDSVTPEFLAELCGESAQPWNTDQADDEIAAYRDFGGVFAQIIDLDGKAEISEAECQAFAEVLDLSSVTSR